MLESIIDYCQEYKLSEDELRQFANVTWMEDGLSYSLLNDYPLMQAILSLAKQCKEPNPYYKIIEVICRVKGADKFTWADLQTIKKYYKIDLAQNIERASEFYLGELSTRTVIKSKLSSIKNTYMDYHSFHRLLTNLV